jgi:Arc/MetJ-type ribon-helix-helix transcriptional regulator
MHVPLNRRQLEFIEEQIRSGRAASQEEILREGLELLMERDAEERRTSEAWCEDARQKIEEAYQESFTEEGIDGHTLLEALRVELEAGREDRP